MSRDDILEICRIFFCSHFDIDISECVETAEFYMDFEADDLDNVELAEFVQDRFDVNFFDDDEFDVRKKTFGEFIDLVEKRINL